MLCHESIGHRKDYEHAVKKNTKVFYALDYQSTLGTKEWTTRLEIKKIFNKKAGT